MIIFNRKAKENEIKLEIALNDVKSTTFELRAGDRLIVSNLGNYNPFVLTPNFKGWIESNYGLTNEQAEKVYQLLASRARRYMSEQRDTLAKRLRRESFWD